MSEYLSQTDSRTNFMKYASVSLYMSAFLIFLDTLSCSAIVAFIYISVSLSMVKHLTQPTWQNARISISLLVWQEYLSDCRQASRFICISDWLSPVCSLCMFWYSQLACPATMFQCVFLSSVLCLSANISTSLPACLFGPVSSHPPRLTPDNATRVDNRGVQQASVKVSKT